MIVFKNYSRLGACMHTANHPEGDTPRDLSVNHEFIYKEVHLPESQLPPQWQPILIIISPCREQPVVFHPSYLILTHFILRISSFHISSFVSHPFVFHPSHPIFVSHPFVSHSILRISSFTLHNSSHISSQGLSLLPGAAKTNSSKCPLSPTVSLRLTLCSPSTKS